MQLYFSTKKIKSYKFNDFKKLDEYLIALSHYVGIKDAPQKEIREQIIMLLKEYFSTFSLEEIQKAMGMALTYNLGLGDDDIKHFQKLTPQWISKILKSYSKHRGLEIKKFNEIHAKEEEKRRRFLSADEENKSLIKASIQNFVRYKETGEIIDLGNVIYSFLFSKKIIIIDNATKKKLFDIARNKLIAEQQNKKNQANIYAKKSIADFLDKIVSGEENNAVVIQAKKLALKYFYDQLISEGSELNKILKKVQ